ERQQAEIVLVIAAAPDIVVDAQPDILGSGRFDQRLAGRNLQRLADQLDHAPLPETEIGRRLPAARDGNGLARADEAVAYVVVGADIVLNAVQAVLVVPA